MILHPKIYLGDFTFTLMSLTKFLLFIPVDTFLVTFLLMLQNYQLFSYDFPSHHYPSVSFSFYFFLISNAVNESISHLAYDSIKPF